ncbi:polygalacturonase inhibitor 2 isoform X2 [Amborella trichopoda]|uniref:polygalacturonase inhibitor 2 isoform X2 n=1 Tax=Amborella trichopoda TaxID=13333 RepID=UPI0005D423C3|nr:polygalacturonase inhibitor 2 isoform X2 [Amborella trichopoda]|eukprot:XP_011627686.1 polygalacturonase inhibitor 2 isoform X2 [Amborella trichopoda]
MAYCNFPSSIVSPFSLLILLLLTLFAHSSVYSLPLCHEHERAALLKFRASLIHPSETSKGVEFLESWKGLNCCHWERELSKLRNLNFLYLDSNDFEGPIPEEVGLLTSLHELWLDDCRLQGSIPSALDNLHHLKELSLGGNQLDGSIPPSLCALPAIFGKTLSEG